MPARVAFGDGPLKVAMVGAGFVAPLHLRGWQMVPDARVVAISSRTRAKAAALADEFAVDRVFDDVAVMLDTAKPHVLDICSSADTHLAFVTRAAERGVDAICQKPIAATMADAERIRDVARDAGIRLMVHENFRFRPWYREIKRLLDAGTIGKVHYCRSDGRMPGTVITRDHPDVPWSLKRQAFFADLDRFLILESAIHQIDVCRYLFGEVRRVYARSRRVSPRVKGEDQVSMILDFDRLHAVVERSYAARGHPAPPMASEIMTIEGDRGALFLDRDGRIRVEIDIPGERATRIPDIDLTDAYPNSYAATIRHFADQYRSGAPFETDIDDNLKTLAVTLAAYDSAARGQSVCFGASA